MLFDGFLINVFTPGVKCPGLQFFGREGATRRERLRSRHYFKDQRGGKQSFNQGHPPNTGGSLAENRRAVVDMVDTIPLFLTVLLFLTIHK